jgi:ribosomal protein S6--L-glutamate ligase
LRASPTRIVALVSGFGWHVQDLRRGAKSLGLTFDAVGFRHLTGHVSAGGRIVDAAGLSFASSDGVLVRMMPPGTLEQVIFRMDALHRLKSAGVAVLNSPRAVEISVDKYLSLALIEEAGLSVPSTFAGESASDALMAFEALGGDVVVKPLFGSEGRGLVRVSDYELARRVFVALERTGSVIYAQQAVRHPGYDYRAFVLGGRVLGAMRRFAPGDDWRTNIAVGGRPEACALDSTVERLALDAARAVGAEMAGVDILEDLDRGKPVVLEVNAIPGWRALSGASGIDVAIAILDHLREMK